MAANEQEPDAREVEALATETRRVWYEAYEANGVKSGFGMGGAGDLAIARFILSRESALVAAIRDAQSECDAACNSAASRAWLILDNALASHRAARQPQEPTPLTGEELELAHAMQSAGTEANAAERIVRALSALVAVKVNAR